MNIKARKVIAIGILVAVTLAIAAASRPAEETETAAATEPPKERQPEEKPAATKTPQPTARPARTQQPQPAETPKRQPRRYIGKFELTAYCACTKCCGKTDGITASGAKAREGVTIAADWRVIPKGTEVEIEGVGERTVQDRGGAIKGRRIDLFFDSHEKALQFGRQKLKVWIVRSEKFD